LRPGGAAGLNWLVPVDDDPAARGRCQSDTLIRRKPDADDTIAREKLVPTAAALRRLVYQLTDLGLPVDPYWRRDGGLAFDLLSSYSTGEKVTIGHANGVITIDLVESLDAYRESLRVRLGEPYRTMLGHFRHEVGHYYQNILVETGPGAARYLDRCRDLFGDERTDYSEALARHYRFGAPANWRETFISEYATMHPWEDFAECFAHYLHITDTIDTTREAGMVLHADRVRFSAPGDITPLESYCESPIERLLADWKWISLFFNRVNAAMGKRTRCTRSTSAPPLRTNWDLCIWWWWRCRDDGRSWQPPTRTRRTPRNLQMQRSAVLSRARRDRPSHRRVDRRSGQRPH